MIFTQADRYLMRGAGRYSLGMLIGLVALYVFGQMVDKLQDLGHGHFDVLALLQYVALGIPKMAYDLLPLAVLLGVMAYLSLLASHSELVALRMSGWSLSRLARPLWVMAFVAGLLIFVLGQWVVPLSSPAAEALFANTTNAGQQIQMVGGDGIWFREGASVIRIGNVEGDGALLREVMVLNSPHLGRLQGGLVAANALFQGGQWTLRNVQISTIGTDSLSVRQVAEIPWHTAITPKVLRSYALAPDLISTSELWRMRKNLQSEGLKANRVAVVWWRRLTYPFVPAIMVAIVLPFVVSSHRGGGVAGRLLVGLLLGLVFHFMNQMSGYISVAGGLAPWVSALLPLFTFMLIAWILMARAL